MAVPTDNQDVPTAEIVQEISCPNLPSASRRSSIQLPVVSPGYSESIGFRDEIRHYQSDTTGDMRLAHGPEEILGPSPAMTTNEDSQSTTLQTQIHEIVTSNHDGDTKRSKGFITYATLRGIMSIKAVEDELKRCENFLSRRLKRFLRGSDYMRDDAQMIRGPEDRPHRRTSVLTPEPSTSAAENRQNNSYIIIMGILIMLERSSEIRSFSKEVSDIDLPLVKSLGWDKHPELRRRNAPGTPLKCFKHWNKFRVARFEEEQWKFLPATFEKVQDDVRHNCFEPARILPFTTLSASPGMNGGSAVVTKVRIHPQCHSFECGNDQVFAIKELKSKNRRAFDHEKETLKRYSNKRRHCHIIYLLATFEQDDVFYFLFPAAEVDLRKYWETQQPRRGNPEVDQKKSLKWLAEQCEGLADGLHQIHQHSTWETSSRSLPRADSVPSETTTPRLASQPSEADPHGLSGRVTLFGRHGDIKPENILWFPDSHKPQDMPNGVLKIADFGLTKFSKQESGVRKRGEHIPGTKSYMAPECRRDPTAGVLGPWTDIWSLGCVYLEFLAWWFGDWKCVQDFRKRRMEDQNESMPEFWDDRFFVVASRGLSTSDSQGPQAYVKTSVTEFIHDLKGKSKCEVASRILNMIEINMILVHVEDKTSPPGTRDTGKRLTAKAVSQRLQDIRSGEGEATAL